MKKIGFIGAYDKTDILIYLAKILTALGSRVLVVDSTVIQKAKYIVPVINPTRTYITQFENFDVAVGFQGYEDMSDYLGIDNIQDNYDIALLDIDIGKNFDGFEIYNSDKLYFVTSFDLYSLKRGVEALSGLNENVHIKKIIFSKAATTEENDYLNFLSADCNVTWDNDIIYFPLDRGDASEMIENQITSKIKFKNFSDDFMQAFNRLVGEITQADYNELRKIYKVLEKNT